MAKNEPGHQKLINEAMTEMAANKSSGQVNNKNYGLVHAPINPLSQKPKGAAKTPPVDLKTMAQMTNPIPPAPLK